MFRNAVLILSVLFIEYVNGIPSLKNLCFSALARYIDSSLTSQSKGFLLYDIQEKQELETFFQDCFSDILQQLVEHCVHPRIIDLKGRLLDISSDHHYALILNTPPGNKFLSSIQNNLSFSVFDLIKNSLKCVDHSYPKVCRIAYPKILFTRGDWVVLYSVEQGKKISSYYFPECTNIEFLTQDRAIFATDDTIVVYDLSSCERGNQLIRHNEKKIAIMKDQIVLSTGSNICKSIKLWNHQTSDLKTIYEQNNSISSFATLNDSFSLAAAFNDNRVHVWKINNNELAEHKELEHGSSVVALSFNPQGNFLLAGTDGSEGAIYLWDLQNCKILEKWVYEEKHLKTAISTLSWSDDNKSIIFSNYQGKTYVFDPVLLRLGLELKKIFERKASSDN